MSTQLSEILYTDFQDMLILLSTVALRYYKCCDVSAISLLQERGGLIQYGDYAVGWAKVGLRFHSQKGKELYLLCSIQIASGTSFLKFWLKFP
jgi:hypothetical protein